MAGVPPQSPQADAPVPGPLPSPSHAPSEPDSNEVRYAPDRSGLEAQTGRRLKIEKNKRRWLTDASYRNYSALVGRTYDNPDVYTVWPWRPVGEFVSSPYSYQGLRLERWQTLTHNSEPPTAEMARYAVELINRYVNEGIERFQFRLPMFPGDLSYQTTEPDPDGSLPPSTAELLGFSKDDFIQHVE